MFMMCIGQILLGFLLGAGISFFMFYVVMKTYGVLYILEDRIKDDAWKRGN